MADIIKIAEKYLDEKQVLLLKTVKKMIEQQTELGKQVQQLQVEIYAEKDEKKKKQLQEKLDKLTKELQKIVVEYEIAKFLWDKI